MNKTHFRASGWVVLFSVLGLAACSDPSGSAQAQGTPPPTEVDVVTMTAQPLDITDEMVGRVTAYRVAEIRPQVSGIILERSFEEGAYVEEGELLYTIDPAVYEAQLADAKAQLAVASANAKTAKLKAERYLELVSSAAVSRQEADDAEAAWKQADAQIKAAEAAVKSASINIEYTQVLAPISGVISRSSVTEGALVTAQQTTAMATIRQISPIYVDSKRAVSSLLAEQSQASPSATLTLENGMSYPETGVVKFTEASVDQDTGTVNVRSQFANADGRLIPGMYVRVQMVKQHFDQAFLVPQRATTRLPSGELRVLVVNADNQVESRLITAELAREDNWVVTAGIADGDRVITVGGQKVAEGATVTPNDLSAAQMESGE